MMRKVSTVDSGRVVVCLSSKGLLDSTLLAAKMKSIISVQFTPWAMQKNRKCFQSNAHSTWSFVAQKYYFLGLARAQNTNRCLISQVW